MSAAEEKKFAIKHNFTNINAKIDKLHGEEETHYNVPWVIDFSFSFPSIFSRVCHAQLTCLEPREADDEWSIETKIEMRSRRSLVMFKDKVFSKSANFVVFEFGDNAQNTEVEFHVTILKMSGIKGEKLRNFDESTSKFSDVVLKVKDEKFYVHKVYLATHSSYFESLLFGSFQESGKLEIELKDVDSKDFRNFLELLYAESLVEDKTFQGILHLADFFDAKTVIRRCEEFLIEKSNQPLKVKFEIAIKYKFDQLKRTCISEMKTSSDVISVIPEDASKFDPTIWKELLLKCHDVKK